MYQFTSSITKPLYNIVRVILYSGEREQIMRLLHDSMRVVLGPLQECELKEIVVKTTGLFAWKYVMLLVP